MDDFFLKFLKNTKGNKDVQKIVLTLESALGENLPLLSRDGNFIKAGFDAKHLMKLENLEMKLKP